MGRRFKFKSHFIYWYRVFTGIVLQHPRQERLGEIEARNPKGDGSVVRDPVVEETQSATKVKSITVSTNILPYQ